MTPGHFLPALLLQAAAETSLLQQFTASRIFAAVAVLIGAWLLIRWLSQLLELFSQRSTKARFFIKWFQPVLRITLWFAAAIVIFDLLAPSRDTFFATVASVGIALGLGAQDLVKNIIGGLVVLTDRPFQLGDRVKMGEAYGEIDHIGLRSTKLTTPDDTRVTIPNSDILSHQVYNANSGVPDCQVVTDIYLPPDSDPEQARRVGWEAAVCCPYLLPRKPIGILVGHGMDRRPFLRLRIKCYVHDHRYEPRMMSDITARACGELNRLGVLAGWKEEGEGDGAAEKTKNITD